LLWLCNAPFRYRINSGTARPHRTPTPTCIRRDSGASTHSVLLKRLRFGIPPFVFETPDRGVYKILMKSANVRLSVSRNCAKEPSAIYS